MPAARSAAAPGARAPRRAAGILVERMAPPGVELLVSARADAVVPCIVVAIGGAWTELLDDAAIVPLPATSARVEAAIRALRGAPLLTGGRGRQPFDVAAAARLAAAAGELLVASGLELLELNPGAGPRAGRHGGRRRGRAAAADPAAIPPARVRAVVVGAGLAGLVAADELARAGAEVVVLEARPRVGGRVWSQTASERRRRRDGRGVHPAGQHRGPRAGRPLRARALGQGHALRTARPARRHRHHPRGARRRDGDGGGELAAQGSEAGSAEEFLDSLDIPAGAREAILARVEISCANTADRVAAADLAGVAHIDDEPSPSIAGGNQRLPLALAEELGVAVHLDDPATLIDGATASARASASGESRPTPASSRYPRACSTGSSSSRPCRIPLRHALGLVQYGHAAKLFVPLRTPGRAERRHERARALLDLDRDR